ncbi:MAG: protein kinase [Cyanobacteria bacterium SZAS-4]|nr:protein kinase [Cyanobacteria bacterium SZAS-4]
MDDQFDQNLRNSLNINQLENLDLASLSDQRQSFLPGQIIDTRFRVIRELGRGGTGTVYQVEQILLKKEFAMKILDPIQVTGESWRRFQKEAQAAGRLDHPGFVKVYDFGLIDNQTPYFTMDFVSGDTLAERLRKEGPMSVTTALPLFIQLCFALDHAHSQGVIHRDLKPSNISSISATANADAQVKILDFGIAKLVGVDTTNLTQVGSVFGTPFYMSPEQCLGQPVDHRSDIYSLGCVFFELLTGAPPFTTENALTLMMQHQSDKPPSLKEASMGGQFPAALEALIQKMLAKNPSERYQRLVDTANDLIDLQQGNAPSVNIAKKIREDSSSGTKKLLLVGVFGLAITAIAGATFYFVQAKNKPEPEPITHKAVTKDVHDMGSLRSLEDETVQQFDKNMNVDYSDVDDKYFSSDVKRDGMPFRLFKFSKKSSIGDITYTDLNGKMHDEPAKGEVYVPKFPVQPSIINMAIDWKMCKTSPQLLKKFRPDEIGYLRFKDDDYRKTIANDDIFDDTLSFVDDLQGIYAIDLPSPVTDNSVEHLAKLSHLLFLGANRTQITGDALKKAPFLRQLRGLKISMVKNARAVLPKLKQSQVLTSLKLVADNIQDSDLKILTDCSSLEELALRDNPKTTDVGLTYLIGLPKLKRISLDGCAITPRATKTLQKMNVKELICLDVSHWSKADREELRNSVSCKVQSWNYDHQEPRSFEMVSTESESPVDGEVSIMRKKALDRGE